jgi:ADP-heptose:LPS heptosyltransferase
VRSLRPDSRGIFVPTTQEVKTGGQITPYSKSSTSLIHLDYLMRGGTPKIAVTRRQGGIGDVLMTLPTVKAISKKYGVQVDYGTDFDYLSGALPKVLKYNPYIHNIVPWKEIRPEDYHAIVELTCPCVAHEEPLARPINRIDLFARHAGLGIPLQDPSIDYFISPEEDSWARNYLITNGIDRFKLIMVQPSSSSTSRDIPPATLRTALTSILSSDRTLRAIVITHDSDNLKQDWNFTDVHKLHNKDVRHLAAIMKYCELVICQDSAVLHVASALHKPTVTLFGPTDPKARVNYHPEAIAIWPAQHLRNYPSWYRDSGDGGLCWKLIKPELITSVSLSILNKTPLLEKTDLVTFGNYQ